MTLVLKPLNRAYKIFKVYLTFAVLGALAVIVVGIIVAKPLTLVVMCLTLATSIVGIVLYVQTLNLSFPKSLEKRFRNLQKSRPPKLPESVMAVVVPTSQREEIIGELREEYGSLIEKYGRASATAWYIIQTTLFVCNLSTVEKYHAKTERVALRFAMFFLYLCVMYELITQFLSRILK